MSELIKISETNGKKVVSARELHMFLEIETPLNKWVTRMFEYGFEENIDWTKLSFENQQVDWALTIECAKHLAMMQRTEKGMEARNYFIEMERLALTPREFSRKELAQMIIEAETAKELAEAKVLELAPKAEVFDTISNADNLLDFNSAAKSLEVGRNVLMKRLREQKILRSNNTPYQQYIDAGYFKVKIKPVKFASVDTNYAQTFVTGKGLTWLAKPRIEQINISNHPINIKLPDKWIE